MKWLIRLLLFIMVLPLLLVLLWYIGVPEEYITDKIEKAVSLKELSISSRPVDVVLKISGFRKKLFFGFYIKELELFRENTSSDKVLLSVYHLTGRLRLDRLLIGKLEIETNGFVTPSKKGEIELCILADKEGYKMEFEAEDVQLGRLPILRVIGLKGEGVADIEGVLSVGRDRKSDAIVLLQIKDMRLSDIIQQNLYIPLSLFRELKGVLQIHDRGVEVTSLSMKGKNIYSRLKGSIQRSVFRGRLEIMPEEDFPKIGLYPLKRYKISESYYVIPLNIDLSNRIN
jgi:hypothetical protein